MKYLARLTYNSEFAYGEWEKEQKIPGVIAEKLGDYIIENVNSNVFSFSVLVFEDENQRSCEEHVRAVWEELYPSCQQLLTIMMVEDDDSEISRVMKAIYGAYIGWEEYQRLCTEMARAYSFIENSSTINAYQAMNYLVSIDKGCGFTTLVSSFTDFLQKLDIFEKKRYKEIIDNALKKNSDSDMATDKAETEGEALDESASEDIDSDDKDTYEFDTEYYRMMFEVGEEDKDMQSTTNSIISELQDVSNKMNVVGIDVSYFLDKDKHDKFRRFLHNLQSMKEEYIYIFRVPVLSDSSFKEIQNVIDDIMELRTIRIAPYSDLHLLEECCDYIWKYEYDMNKDVADVFFAKVHKEKMDGRFYGFRTVKKIVNEIIWEKIRHDANAKYMGEDYIPRVISRKDVEEIVPELKEQLSGYDELSELVGMEEILSRLKEIVAQVKMAIKNNKMERPCLHMRFIGAPGTGKTTVARIVGKIFKEQGILRKGDFFEYEARSLCGEYIGQTAPKTHSVCRDAYGSVLFIDEAYGLYTGNSDKDYGQEAITALIAEMENHRDDMVVIMAGYTDDMEKLMEGNSGLRSRMPFIIEFKSYTREQLATIFMSMARKSFICEEELETEVKGFFDRLDDNYLKSKEFSNARFVRNLYERTWAKAALRTTNVGLEEIKLTRTDFELASQEKEFSEKLKTTKKIGF